MRLIIRILKMKSNQILANLRQVVEHFTKKASDIVTVDASIFGIIMDAEAPQYRSQTKDYIADITILDNTIFDSPYKIKICLVSKEKDHVTMSKIGEVVLFSRFEFSWKGRHFFRGKQTSNSSIQRDDELNESKNGPNVEILRQIKYQFEEMFAQLYKPQIGVDKSVLNQKFVIAKPFNMILRIKNFIKTETQESQNLEYKLLDDLGNEYSVFFNIAFQKEAYVIVKNILRLDNDLNLILDYNGNIMSLPKPVPYVYKTIESSKAEFNCTTKFTIIKSTFDIKQIHTTPLIHIIQIIGEVINGQNSHYYNRKQIKERIQQLLLEQKIVKVYPVTTSGGISLYNGLLCLDQMDLTQKKVSKEAYDSYWHQKVTYIFNLTMWVKDPSIQHKNLLFPIHICNSDEIGNNFFPDVDLKSLNALLAEKLTQKHKVVEKGPDNEDEGKIIHYLKEEDVYFIQKQKQKIEQKMQQSMLKIFEKTDPINLMTLLIEPMLDMTSVNFRITRTKLYNI